MAIEDYKKKKSKLAVLRKQYEAALKTRQKQISELEKSAKFLIDQVNDMKYVQKLDQRYLLTSCEKLEAMTVEIMFIQEDFKEAVKAKQKDEIKNLTAKMKALIAKEKPEEKKFGQLHKSLLARVTVGEKLNKWFDQYFKASV
jgi:hypothetical protein